MREGFLCPLCLKDLQSFYQLQSHYEEEHSGEDRDVKGQLRSKRRDSWGFLTCLCFRRVKFRTTQAACTASSLEVPEKVEILTEAGHE